MIDVDYRKIMASISMADAIEVIRRAFIEFDDVKGVFPPREIIDLDSVRGNIGVVMPASCRGYGFGVKVSTITPENARQEGLSLINSVYVLFDEATGVERAVMDGRAVTYLRTGAVSGLFVDLLSAVDSRRLAVIGAGLQARSHITAVCAVRDIREVRVYSRREESSLNLCEEFAGLFQSIDFLPCRDVKSAVNAADIVCTTTSTDCGKGFLAATDLVEHVHICGVGGRTLNACEVIPSSLRNVFLVVDDYESAMRECAEMRSGVARGYFSAQDIKTLAFLVNQDPVSLELLRQRKSYSRSVGIPFEDIAMASAILRKI